MQAPSSNANSYQRQPWSKKHKRVFRDCPYSLSNSFAQPLSHGELVDLTLKRGDRALVDAFQNHTLEYTPNGGSLDLRTDIATFYGPTITPDHILVFSGAQVALQTAAMAFAASCHSIVFTPGYQSTVELPFPSRSVTQIPRSPANNWQVDLQLVREAIQEDTRFLILNEPYNPAGTLMLKETQSELVALAAKHSIIILCDEVYRLLEHNDSSSTSTNSSDNSNNNIRLPAMCDAYPQGGISCVTLSKPWGGCGITIGWLACTNLELKQQMVDVQYFGTACVSRASELQAMMTLRASDIILDKNLKIIRHNKRLLEAFMSRFDDLFSWVPPTAGAIAFVKFQGPLSSEALGDLLQQEAGISMKPAYCFTGENSDNSSTNTNTNTSTDYSKYFRVGFGEKIMPQALEALTIFVEEHKDEWRQAMPTKTK